MAVWADIQCDEYKNGEMSELEAVCIRIPLSSSNIFIYCLYIQCGGSGELYHSHLKAIKTLRSDISINDDIIILGDFNLGSAATWEANDNGFDFIPKTNIAIETTTVLMDEGFFQMTEIGNKFGNTLDLVYTDSPELVVVNRADFLLLPLEKSDD